jgi:hypothetical protein
LGCKRTPAEARLAQQTTVGVGVVRQFLQFEIIDGGRDKPLKLKLAGVIRNQTIHPWNLLHSNTALSQQPAD